MESIHRSKTCCCWTSIPPLEIQIILNGYATFFHCKATYLGLSFIQNTVEKVLQNYAGITMPKIEQPFRLNQATFSTDDKRSDNIPDLSIFVGDLAVDVTDSMLHETFASKYPSIKAEKVVFDTTTGRSKGYGFVRFGDDNERSLAMTEMNGVYCSSRPMRIGVATPRKSSCYQRQRGLMLMCRRKS